MAFCTVFTWLKGLRPKGTPFWSLGSSDDLHKAYNRMSPNHSCAGSKTIWPQCLWPQPSSQRNSSLCEKVPEYICWFPSSLPYLMCPLLSLCDIQIYVCVIHRYRAIRKNAFIFFFQTPINFGFSTNLTYLTKWVPSYYIKKCCWKKHTVIGRSCQSLCSLKPDAIPLESVE